MMEEKEELKFLYQLYLNNLCSAQELERFFELIGKQQNDTALLSMMALTWDDLEAIPSGRQVPDFLQQKALPEQAIPERKSYRLFKPFAAAAAVFLILAGAYLFRAEFSALINPVHQMSSISANNERKQLQLKDGTKVWLSPNSKLSYPDQFKGSERLVTLDGEAFFEVAKDASHPFIIQSGAVSTKVLGTSFNISAYAAQPDIRITLVTGKVAVALKTGSNTTEEIITANQRITINKIQEKIVKTNFPDAADFLNRRLGVFDYKGTAFNEVINDLELQYHIDIKSLPEMDKSMFYGQLDMTAPIDQALNKLTTVMEINWKKDGGQYVITK